MNILSISSDRRIFEEGSEARARQVEYAGLFAEYHIVVFTTRSKNYELGIKNGKTQIGRNCWVYPTDSFSRWFYIFDAVRIGASIIRNSKFLVYNSALTAQDPFESGLVIYRLAKRFGLKFQLQIHTDFLSPFFVKTSLLNRLRILIARRILPKADGVRVVSERIKKTLQANSYKLKADPVVLPIFVDSEKIKNSPITIDLHQKYPQFRKIILMVARLSPEKNVGFGIEIFSEVIKKFSDCGLIIVGEGSLKASLKSKVESYRLGGQVLFEGFQTRETIYSYYKTADLFLQTSLYEGYGLALVEAIISGCSAVSSDAGVAAELARLNNKVLVCGVNDRDRFIKNIDRIFSENSFRGGAKFEVSDVVTKADYLKKYRENLVEICRR